MTGQHRFLALGMLASAVLNLVLSMGLIATYGIQGAALGTLAAVVLVEAGLILPRACRHSRVSATTFFVNVVWPPLPALLPMLVGAWALDQWMATDSLGLLFFKVMLCVMTYLAAFTFTGISASERGQLAQTLRLRQAPAVSMGAE